MPVVRGDRGAGGAVIPDLSFLLSLKLRWA